MPAAAAPGQPPPGEAGQDRAPQPAPGGAAGAPQPRAAGPTGPAWGAEEGAHCGAQHAHLPHAGGQTGRQVRPGPGVLAPGPLP